MLDTTVVAGTAGGNCKAVSGTVQVCARKYGFNGWLGLAQIWINGSSHITKGLAKMNDTYFNTSTYNTQGWRSLVMCQEVGHTFGLGHQDENFSNPPIDPHTCMDYHVPGSSEFEHPNQHDYDQLALIYEHLDGSTTVASGAPGWSRGRHGAARNGHSAAPEDLDHTRGWGKAIHADHKGRPDLFVRDLDGETLFTFVFWSDEATGEEE